MRAAVVELVLHRQAPKQLWPYILFHVVPILETAAASIFSFEDMQALLASLQVGELAFVLPHNHTEYCRSCRMMMRHKVLPWLCRRLPLTWNTNLGALMSTQYC